MWEVFYFMFLQTAVHNSQPSGTKILSFTVLPTLGQQPTSGPSGGDIFLIVKKDIEERHAKGLQSRPLESGFLYGGMRGDVLASYVFALVQLTRFRPVRRRAGGVRFEKPSTTFMQHAARLQALLPPDSCLLRCPVCGTTYDFSRHRTPRVFASRHNIFRCTTKDGATGGLRISRESGKTVKS